MKVINPFNRVPETEESLALGCRCMCTDGSANMQSNGSMESDHCGCHCGGGDMNDYFNDSQADAAANGHYQNA